MAEPFLSEIRIMSFNFPPKGWAFCNGQLLPINQNQALFSLLGTTYGGDGRVNFALPDLQGRVPIHMSQGHTLGERGGEQAHTVNISEMPLHTHLVNATSSTGTLNNASNNVLGVSQAPVYVGSGGSITSLVPETITPTGGSQAHLNMQPFLVINFSIALQGIFPSQN
jgi:microcystin-dependent protein